MRFFKIDFGRFTTVVQNASWLSVFEIMRMAMPFIALPYLIQTVGVTNYGTVVFVQSIIAFFILLINYGFDTSAVRDVSIYRHDKKQLDKIVSAICILKTLIACISFMLMLGLLALIPKFTVLSTVFYFAFLACISHILLPVWYFQGKEEMKKLTIVKFFSIASYTVSIFIFIRKADDYPYIALLQSIGFLLSGAISCYYVFGKDKIRLHVPSIDFLKKIFRESSPFFLSRASLTVNTNMAKIMSGFLLSEQVVAAFDVAQKVINGGMIPVQMFNQALYPNMSKSQDKTMLRRGFGITAVLTLSVSVCIFLISDVVVRLLSVGQTPESIGILRIMCLCLFFAGFSVFMGTSTLVAFGYQKPFNVSVVWSTVVLLVCYSWMVLSGNNSIYMYAFALVAAELMIFLYRFYYCQRYGLLSWKDIFKGIK